MVLDTSAVLAILQREPERRSFLEAIEAFSCFFEEFFTNLLIAHSAIE